MHNFRTELNLTPGFPIHHKTPMLTIGSCFADHLGLRLKEYKFPCFVNPFGISYNPVAIHQTLRLALHNQPIPENLFVHNQDIWHHFLFHSQWSDGIRENLAMRLQKQVEQVNDHIKATKAIILTYGTAWTYRHLETGALAANCHKIPSAKFDKFLLSPAQIIESFQMLHESLTQVVPGARIILTVSPVRHTRDTLELNSVSKAALRWRVTTSLNSLKELNIFRPTNC
jgi:GSCFA family